MQLLIFILIDVSDTDFFLYKKIFSVLHIVYNVSTFRTKAVQQSQRSASPCGDDLKPLKNTSKRRW